MPGTRKSLAIAAITAASMAAPSVQSAEQKTLTRIDDPLVMECSSFSPLAGKNPSKMSLMAKSGREWKPIPFQIDQKKPDGSYAFTSGPVAGPDPDPNLDDNDELVFMVKDTGDRAEQCPPGALEVLEIEVSDPNNGAKGWVYLAGYGSDPPRSADDYIRVEVFPEQGRRQVVTYEYVMGGPSDRIYPDLLAATELPDGNPGKDVLDRLKMRGEVELPLGLSVDFQMDEITRCEDRGWIDGPVRVLQLAEGYMELASFIKLRGQGYSLISYYVNHMIWPMEMEIPFDTWHVVRGIDFRGYMDFVPAVYGSHPFNEANPLCPDVTLDGKMSPAEKALDLDSPITWTAGFGPQGALVSRLMFVPENPNVVLYPYYLDDASVMDLPEEVPGVSGVGFKIKGFEVPTQDPDTLTYQYYYFMSNLRPEDIDRILDILDHPVKTDVNRLECGGNE